MDPAIKPGYLTTEFYVTLAGFVLPLCTFIWHRDFSGYVQTVAQAAAAIASVAYIISRAVVKRAHVEAGVGVALSTATAGAHAAEVS